MYQQIKNSLKQSGLHILSSFHIDQGDLPTSIKNEPIEYVLLMIGNAGSSSWPNFIKSVEYQDGLADPMDRWSKRIANKLRNQFGGFVAFPFDGPPYYPFVSWANNGGMSSISTLGLSIHTEFGLWHAYRFALFIPASKVKLPKLEKSINPCVNCSQPCLTACPVNAFTGSDYRYLDCVKFLSNNSNYECNTKGCASRRACPEARAFQYDQEHAQFHMSAFINSHT